MAMGEFQVVGGIIRVGGFQGKLPAGSRRKEKIGIPHVLPTRLVSDNFEGILSVGSQKIHRIGGGEQAEKSEREDPGVCKYSSLQGV